MSPKVAIRPYRSTDADAITILWRIAREKSLPDFQQRKGHFFYEDCDYFRNYVVAKNRIWVATSDTQRVGFMAINGSFVDQLYIHPDHWRRGIGHKLLDHAKRLSPQHVWLYTLQINTGARAFYEKHGFIAEKLGISPPPESEPDVEYHWRPQSQIANRKS